MSLFKRVQNILEEDRKAYFSPEQTDLYENKFVSKTYQAIRKLPIVKKLEKNVVKGGGNLFKSIKKRFVKTSKTNVNKSNIDTDNMFDNKSNVNNKKKKIYTKKTEIPKTEIPKTETPKTETIIRPNVKNKKYRNEDGSFNQKLYDKEKIDYKKSFIENPKVDPKPNPKPDPKPNPKPDPKPDPKVNFKNTWEKLKPVAKTAVGLGAAAIVTNKVLDNSKTEAELEKIKKQNKKLTTTNNGNNNKGIVISPNNNDATTTTKKLYPAILKFGLGSGK